MSLKILLTLSLINRWDVITATMSSALLQAPIAIEELVLVQPPPELEKDRNVLWTLTRDVYGITTSNKVDPCIFASQQLIVMIHLDALLIVVDRLQQESFINQLSASISLKDIPSLMPRLH